MNKYSKPCIIWSNVGGHNPAVGMETDFDLHDFFKPHLSPVLPHCNQTRVLQVNLITTASTLTLKPHLSPALPRTGNGFSSIKICCLFCVLYIPLW